MVFVDRVVTGAFSPSDNKGNGTKAEEPIMNEPVAAEPVEEQEEAVEAKPKKRNKKRAD